MKICHRPRPRSRLPRYVRRRFDLKHGGVKFTSASQCSLIPMKAVIVEDDALVGDAIRRALHRAGFDVEHLVTGIKGLEALLRPGVDLGVIDIDLPDLDGLELVRQLRHARLALPLVMLSAHDAAVQRACAMAAGASDYLAKPFEVTDLIARCRAHVVHTLPETAELSGCQRRIYDCLSRDVGHIVSRERLAGAADCAPAEIDARVAELRDKLAPPARIRQVRGLGYRID